MFEPLAKATPALPPARTVKLTVAIAWVPLWAVVAAQARLTVPAVWLFCTQSVNGPFRLVLCQLNSDEGNVRSTWTALMLSPADEVSEIVTVRVLPTV